MAITIDFYERNLDGSEAASFFKKKCNQVRVPSVGHIVEFDDQLPNVLYIVEDVRWNYLKDSKSVSETILKLNSIVARKANVHKLEESVYIILGVEFEVRKIGKLR